MSAFVKTVCLAQKLCAANPVVARQAIRSSKCESGLRWQQCNLPHCFVYVTFACTECLQTRISRHLRFSGWLEQGLQAGSVSTDGEGAPGGG